jgi:hypothetical protein
VITIVHGGQTGVDRGAHDAALDNAWRVTGYMPRDGRDELGQIPQTVARFLMPHDKPGLGARTEANVRAAAAALIVVRKADDPRVTPGTAQTVDLVTLRHLPQMVVDPTTDPTKIARWIWSSLLAHHTLMLPLGALPREQQQEPPRLLVAGPRESKWPGAQIMTATLLRHTARALITIQTPP